MIVEILDSKGRNKYFIDLNEIAYITKYYKINLKNEHVCFVRIFLKNKRKVKLLFKDAKKLLEEWSKISGGEIIEN